MQMNQALERLSWLVTVRPWVTIVVLLIVTVVLAAGANLRAPPTEGASVAFLPPGHAIANATREIDEFFGDSGEISIVTLLFRGDALTPSGLTQMDDLINEIVSEPGVTELLVPVGAVVAPSTVIGGLMQAGMAEGSGDAITQDVIDFARTIPEIQGALDAMTGTDADGMQGGDRKHPLVRHRRRTDPGC